MSEIMWYLSLSDLFRLHNRRPLGTHIFICLNFFLFFKKMIYFNWRISALQYWFNLFHTSTWISHRCAYMCSHSWPSLPPPTLFCPSWLLQSPWVTQEITTGYPFHIWWCICLHAPLYSFHPLLPPPSPACVHKALLYVCISTAALQTDSSVLSF